MTSELPAAEIPVLPEESHRPHAGARTERYPDGVHIAAHWHDEDQLVYVSSGLMAAHTGHGVWVASPGRAFLIPAGVEHEHRMYGNTLLHSFQLCRIWTPRPRTRGPRNRRRRRTLT